MELDTGTLVACNIYGLAKGRILPPNQKRGLGVILGPQGSENGEKSFKVRVFYPTSLKGLGIGVLERDLIALSPAGQSLYDNLNEVVLSLVREIDGLKRTVEFLQQSNKAL